MISHFKPMNSYGVITLVSLIRRINFPVIVCCMLLSGCRSGLTDTTPTIEFSKVPLVDEGGPEKMAAIEGRVTGAHPGQQIVLFARSRVWYVQPFTDQPFTTMQPDSTWRNSTHLGTEYAALLVEPDYRPPATTEVLPSKGGGVIAVAAVPGEVGVLVPAFWKTWWFRLVGGLACLLALLVFHRLRLKMVSSIHQRRLEQIEARFFATQTERNRIAREMHDTLLQGIVGASALLGAVNKMMITSPQQAGEYLELARDQLKESLDDIRMAISNLRSQTGDVQHLSGVINESIQRLTKDTPINARCEVFGELQPVPSYVTDNLLRIGCEAVGNAIRHAAPSNIQVELQFDPESIELRIY